MREILFRGKFTKTGEWVYGSAYCSAEKTIIIEVSETMPTRIEGKYVIPKTVGQYTGLCDKNGKNGKKIFEGDIVKVRVTENTGYGTKKYESIYEIKYHEEYCYFYLAREKNNLLFDGNWSYFVSQFEVIGNIHDNPELLKGE